MVSFGYFTSRRPSNSKPLQSFQTFCSTLPLPASTCSMDINQEHEIPESGETDEGISFVLELSEHDPFVEKKKSLLRELCPDSSGGVWLGCQSTSDQIKHVLDMMLRQARIIHLDEIELYFGGANALNLVGFNSPRNELEALHSILKKIESAILAHKPKTLKALQDIHALTVAVIHDVGMQNGEVTKIITDSCCEKEKALMQWSVRNGVNSRLDIAYVEGAGRGAIAREDLEIGDIALEIPESLLISEKIVLQSDMFPILEKIECMSAETMLLLWSMKEKNNCSSKFKPYFDTLPTAFNTGLSFRVHALMELDGTSLLEEIVQAKEHLREQYEELFPSLCIKHPDIFRPELYTWERFLWACELWYSNSMKVVLSDGKLITCLIPMAGFLNHSTCAHILHYGKVDPKTQSLKFPLSRPCKTGEQCFLSYGSLSSSHLLTFYGFFPRRENPYDVIPLDIDVTMDEDSEWSNHMVRGTWFAKNHDIFSYGLPPPLLDHLRSARNPTLQTNTRDYLENDNEILGELCSTFEAMREALGDIEFECGETADWDVRLAMDFKDLQKKIISSIVDSCTAGQRLLETELCKSTG